jgi:hypothetical protein
MVGGKSRMVTVMNGKLAPTPGTPANKAAKLGKTKSISASRIA